MINDKNIFECIILDSHIWFPNYVVWGPPSHGHQRRKKIFAKKFPSLESSISNEKTWNRLRKEKPEMRRIFKYDEDKKSLTEIKASDFFTNAYGKPMSVGQNVMVNNIVYEIVSLKVVKWAGLIAEIKKENDIIKTNVSHYRLDTFDNIWKVKNEK